MRRLGWKSSIAALLLAVAAIIGSEQRVTAQSGITPYISNNPGGSVLFFPQNFYLGLNLPSSCTGLPAGTLYNSGGVLGVCGVSIPTTTWYIAVGGATSACGSAAVPCDDVNDLVAANPTLQCGDVVSAGTGTYSQAAMTITATIPCPGSNNALYIECATQFACSATTQVNIETSYVIVMGFSNTSASQACYLAEPPGSNIIGFLGYIDDIASGCSQGGIVYYNNAGGVGMTLTVATIVYDAIHTTSGCDSGIVHGNMENFNGANDYLLAMYNYSYSNVPGGVGTPASSCNSNANSDSTGLNFDTMNRYTGHAVAENNVLINNGGPGFELTSGNESSNAGPVLISQNTSVNNMIWANYNPFAGVSEMWFSAVFGLTQQTTLINNIGRGNNTTLGPDYDNGAYFWVDDPTPASLSDNNTFYSVAGTGQRYKGTASLCAPPHASPLAASSGGANNYGCAGITNTTDPAFTSMTVPGAPSCSGASSTIECMKTYWTNLTPTATTTNNGALTPAPNDAYNTATFTCNAMHAAQKYAPSLFIPGGGLIPVRC